MADTEIVVEHRGLSQVHFDQTMLAMNELARLTGKKVHLQYNKYNRTEVSTAYDMESPDWIVVKHNYALDTATKHIESTEKIGNAEVVIKHADANTLRIAERHTAITYNNLAIGVYFQDRQVLYTLWSGYNLDTKIHGILMMECAKKVAKVANSHKEYTKSSSQDRVRAIIEKCPRTNVEHVKQEISRCDKDLVEYKTRVTDLETQRDKLIKDLAADTDPRKIQLAVNGSVNLYKKLLKEDYETIQFMNENLVIAKTKNIFTIESGTAYQLGAFKVTITPKDVWISNLSRKNPRDSNGPHMGFGNDHCWGNVETQMRALLSNRLYIEALALIREYLGKVKLNGEKVCLYSL